jgi:hypothetical protein
MMNINIWRQFLAPAPIEKYRIYIHSSHRNRSAFVTPDLPNVHLIDYYNSTYCKDLVTPMLGLLAEAFYNSNPLDANYYVFLSADSIPIKPFHVIYNHTALRGDSAVCISPQHLWVWSVRGKQDYIKHHQWLGLNYADAVLSVALFEQGDRNVHKMVRLPGNIGTRCLDEYWWYLRTTVGQAKFYEDKHYSKEKVSNQSRCIMAVFWSKEAGHKFGVWHKDVYSHFIDAVSIAGLEKFRSHHQFLFIRKVASYSDSQRGCWSHGFWKRVKNGSMAITLVGNRGSDNETMLPIDVYMNQTDFYNHTDR